MNTSDTVKTLFRDASGTGVSSERGYPWRTYVPMVTNGVLTPATGSVFKTRYRGRAVALQPFERSAQKKAHCKAKRTLGIREPFKARYTTVQVRAISALFRSMGMSVGTLAVYINHRSPRIYCLTEELIGAVFDSLLSAYPEIFDNTQEHNSVLYRLVRKIFNVGATSRLKVLTDWKEFSNWIVHHCAGTVLLRDTSEWRNGQALPFSKGISLSSGNLFWNLLDIVEIRDLVDRVSAAKEPSRADLIAIAHLRSTRHFPYIGEGTEAKAFETFETVLTGEDPFLRMPAEDLIHFKDAARRLGRECRRKHPNHDISVGSAHVSATSSGEWDNPISKGGQAAGLSAAMREELAKISEEGIDEDTPFGHAYSPPGAEPWKYLFRDQAYKGHLWPQTVDSEFLKDKEFLSQWDGGRIPYPEFCYYGLDAATGYQLLYLAWRHWRNDEAEVKTSTVHEPGNKARIITIGRWWLNLFQMPFGHIAIDMLQFDPAAWSSTHRQEQAWNASKLFIEHSGDFSDQMSCLSSDLKNATNGLSFRLMRELWPAFFEGWFGKKELIPSYLLEVVNLCFTKRRVHLGGRKARSVVTNRGVMMGEAIAKPSLILWGLCSHSVAIFNYNWKVLGLRGSSRRSRQDLWTPPSWDCFHLGGDDHTAIGPIPYLHELTRCFLTSGAQLSPDQHGYSDKFVHYTERMIRVSKLIGNNDGRKPEPRPDHVCMDSLKIRLLTTGLDVKVAKDNKNVAVGKASQLSQYLAWAEEAPDTGWTGEKKRILIAQFVHNMGSLLPNRIRDPDLYAAIHLPREMGGYGLGLPEDIPLFLRDSPPLFRSLLNALITEGVDCRLILRRFRRLCSNPAKRGVESVARLEERIEHTWDQYGKYDGWAPPGAMLSWEELNQRALEWPDRITDKSLQDRRKWLLSVADQHGIIPTAEYAKRATRGSMFRELILSPEQRTVFNSKTYWSSYRALQKDKEVMDFLAQYPPLDPEICELISADDLSHALRSQHPQWFIDTNAEMVYNIGAKVYNPDDDFWEETEWGEEVFQSGPILIPQRDSGRPDLKVDLEFLGWH